MSTRSRTRDLLRWAFEVIEEVVSLLIAAGILVYTEFVAPEQPGNTSLLLDGTILIAGLIAISNLRDRLYRFRRIHESVEQTRQAIRDCTIHQTVGADRFFIGRDESYGELLSTASSISISGITLSGTVQSFRATLRERLEAGAQIRLIILDPTSDEALRQLVLRSWSSVATPEYYKGSLGFISELIGNIGNTPQATGSLEIGYLPFVPSFGITLVSPGQKNGTGFVEIYQHMTDASPGFRIDADKDPSTFQLYREQYNKMWRKCRTQKIV